MCRRPLVCIEAMESLWDGDFDSFHNTLSEVETVKVK